MLDPFKICFLNLIFAAAEQISSVLQCRWSLGSLTISINVLTAESIVNIVWETHKFLFLTRQVGLHVYVKKD